LIGSASIPGCPAISVPSGIGDNGVPTGLQIAAKAHDDIAVFRVAAAFESTWERPFRPD
jgi:Asp-tRNA(Asn)/Glu-tRNA(Gln) amidotransferase A subunit family amidase